MEPLDRPNQIAQLLDYLGLRKNVYKAMENDDPADAVMVILDLLEKSGMMPLQKIKKTAKRSETYRKEGNQAYSNNKEEAIELYNKALLCAPEGSRAMILAYSNRSALLHNKNFFSASLIDVEKCLAIGCPDDISEKLKNRKKDCLSKKWIEDLAYQSMIHPQCLEKYLKLDKQRNPQIPCASAAVGVIMDAGVHKVVATKDIEVGTVVAVETSFVSQNRKESYLTACYYCHKLTFNLIPCDTCCVALFCGEDCRTRCKVEYHDVECQIIEVTLSVDDTTKLALKAVLKMRNSCQSWDEFIEASSKIGRERMQDSPVSDIYDGNNPFSLLNFDDEEYCKYGKMFNQSLMVSDILHQLRNIPLFLPNDDKKKQLATRSLARTMMSLVLYFKTTYILSATQNIQDKTIGMHKFGSPGFFSFLSKLNHSCNPNILQAGLNKEVALIAVQPIKRGTELMVSKLHHWLDRPVPERKRQGELFIVYNILCDCQICIGRKADTLLSKTQKQYLKNMNVTKIAQEMNIPVAADKYFSILCKGLAMVCNAYNSKEYEDVFLLLRKCIFHFQHYETNNILLGITNNSFSL